MMPSNNVELRPTDVGLTQNNNHIVVGNNNNDVTPDKIVDTEKPLSLSSEDFAVPDPEVDRLMTEMDWLEQARDHITTPPIHLPAPVGPDSMGSPSGGEGSSPMFANHTANAHTITNMMKRRHEDFNPSDPTPPSTQLSQSANRHQQQQGGEFFQSSNLLQGNHYQHHVHHHRHHSPSNSSGAFDASPPPPPLFRGDPPAAPIPPLVSTDTTTTTPRGHLQHQSSDIRQEPSSPSWNGIHSSSKDGTSHRRPSNRRRSGHNHHHNTNNNNGSLHSSSSVHGSSSSSIEPPQENESTGQVIAPTFSQQPPPPPPSGLTDTILLQHHMLNLQRNHQHPPNNNTSSIPQPPGPGWGHAGGGGGGRGGGGTAGVVVPPSHLGVRSFVIGGGSSGNATSATHNSIRGWLLETQNAERGVGDDRAQTLEVADANLQAPLMNLPLPGGGGGGGGGVGAGIGRTTPPFGLGSTSPREMPRDHLHHQRSRADTNNSSILLDNTTSTNINARSRHHALRTTSNNNNNNNSFSNSNANNNNYPPSFQLGRSAALTTSGDKEQLLSGGGGDPSSPLSLAINTVSQLTTTVEVFVTAVAVSADCTASVVIPFDFPTPTTRQPTTFQSIQGAGTAGGGTGGFSVSFLDNAGSPDNITVSSPLLGRQSISSAGVGVGGGAGGDGTGGGGGGGDKFASSRRIGSMDGGNDSTLLNTSANYSVSRAGTIGGGGGNTIGGGAWGDGGGGGQYPSAASPNSASTKRRFKAALATFLKTFPMYSRVLSLDGETVSTDADVRQVISRRRTVDSTITISFMPFTIVTHAAHQARLELQYQQQLQQQQYHHNQMSASPGSLASAASPMVETFHPTASGPLIGETMSPALMSAPIPTTTTTSRTVVVSDSLPPPPSGLKPFVVCLDGGGNVKGGGGGVDTSGVVSTSGPVRSPRRRGSSPLLFVEEDGAPIPPMHNTHPSSSSSPVSLKRKSSVASGSGGVGGGARRSNSDSAVLGGTGNMLTHNNTIGSGTMRDGSVSSWRDVFGGGGGGGGGGAGGVGIGVIFKEAVESVPQGKAIVVYHHHSQNGGPLQLVESVATEMKARLLTIDFGQSIQKRPRVQQLKNMFKLALMEERWIVITNASKSITALNALDHVVRKFNASRSGGGGSAGGPPTSDSGTTSRASTSATAIVTSSPMNALVSTPVNVHQQHYVDSSPSAARHHPFDVPLPTRGGTTSIGSPPSVTTVVGGGLRSGRTLVNKNKPRAVLSHHPVAPSPPLAASDDGKDANADVPTSIENDNPLAAPSSSSLPLPNQPASSTGGPPSSSRGTVSSSNNDDAERPPRPLSCPDSEDDDDDDEDTAPPEPIDTTYSRIIILAEPHPHFPTCFTESGNVVFRLYHTVQSTGGHHRSGGASVFGGSMAGIQTGLGSSVGSMGSDRGGGGLRGPGGGMWPHQQQGNINNNNNPPAGHLPPGAISPENTSLSFSSFPTTGGGGGGGGQPQSLKFAMAKLRRVAPTRATNNLSPSRPFGSTTPSKETFQLDSQSPKAGRVGSGSPSGKRYSWSLPTTHGPPNTTMPNTRGGGHTNTIHNSGGVSSPNITALVGNNAVVAPPLPSSGLFGDSSLTGVGGGVGSGSSTHHHQHPQQSSPQLNAISNSNIVSGGRTKKRVHLSTQVDVVPFSTLDPNFNAFTTSSLGTFGSSFAPSAADLITTTTTDSSMSASGGRTRSGASPHTGSHSPNHQRQRGASHSHSGGGFGAVAASSSGSTSFSSIENVLVLQRQEYGQSGSIGDKGSSLGLHHIDNLQTTATKSSVWSSPVASGGGGGILTNNKKTPSSSHIGGGGAPYPHQPLVPHEVRRDVVCGASELFTCLEPAGDGRIATSSSTGNISLFSRKGQRLCSFRAHECSIWAMDFRGHHQLVTGSEDALLSLWCHDAQYRRAGFSGRILTRFTNDVMAVRFVDPLGSDVVFAGGLNGSLCMLNIATSARTVIPTSSIVVSLGRIHARPGRMLMGGGTGIVSVWDVEMGKAVESHQRHSQKVSTVLNHNGSLLLSSGYDGAVAVSDIRMRSVGCRVFPLGGGRAGALTAISAMGHLMAVAAEDNLCVFDLRKPVWEVYRKEAAWGGICRGLVVDGTEGFPIITSASSDGVIRFFGCNQH